MLLVVLLLTFRHGLKQTRDHSPGITDNASETTVHNVADGAYTFTGEAPLINAAITGALSKTLPSTKIGGA